jgi:hypothetical protein
MFVTEPYQRRLQDESGLSAEGKIKSQFPA